MQTSTVFQIKGGRQRIQQCLDLNQIIKVTLSKQVTEVASGRYDYTDWWDTSYPNLLANVAELAGEESYVVSLSEEVETFLIDQGEQQQLQ